MFEVLRKKIDCALKSAVCEMGESSSLREALSYSLLGEGKRLRPILVLLIAEALGNREPIHAALSVEYFHTASLIADDLPCMDDDDLRRNRPSLHKAFGESTALLASYALIAAGYGGIYEAAREWKRENPKLSSSIDAAAVLCLKEAAEAGGLRGATYGQFLDLFPPEDSLETLERIAELKTGTLFEISFVFGWAFGGGCMKRLEELKRCARMFGKAFQIADDLQDAGQDERQERMSFVRVWGMEKVKEALRESLRETRTGLEKLGLWTEPFQTICASLEATA